jgi:hypothetical protein
MKPTVKQQEELQDRLEQEDELIGDLSPHESRLLQKQREDEESLRMLSLHLEELNPNSFPSFDQLRIWKETYARFYLSNVVEDDDFYIWRPIYRQEWKEFISMYKDAPAEERQSGLIQRCILFPSAETILYKRPAGYLQSLETKIMFQSGFVDDNVLLASIKVIK